MTIFNEYLLFAGAVIVCFFIYYISKGKKTTLAAPVKSKKAKIDVASLNPADYAHQLKAVRAASLCASRVINREAYGIFQIIEQVLKTGSRHRYRVLAEVSLGAFIARSAHDALDYFAWRALNAKRIDFLIIDGQANPVVAIEYHGSGHDIAGGHAKERDAVKRAALEKAGIDLIEIYQEHDARKLADIIIRLLVRHEISVKKTA